MNELEFSHTGAAALGIGGGILCQDSLLFVTLALCPWEDIGCLWCSLMTKPWGVRHGPHVTLVNSSNCVSEQNCGDMAEGSSGYGKKNTDLVSCLSQGPGKEALGVV